LFVFAGVGASSAKERNQGADEGICNEENKIYMIFVQIRLNTLFFPQNRRKHISEHLLMKFIDGETLACW